MSSNFKRLYFKGFKLNIEIIYHLLYHLLYMFYTNVYNMILRLRDATS